MTKSELVVRTAFNLFAELLTAKLPDINELVPDATLSLYTPPEPRTMIAIKCSDQPAQEAQTIVRISWVPFPDTINTTWCECSIKVLVLDKQHEIVAEFIYDPGSGLDPGKMVDEVWPKLLEALKRSDIYSGIEWLLTRKGKAASLDATIAEPAASAEFDAFLTELQHQIESTYQGEFACVPCSSSNKLPSIAITSKSRCEISAIVSLGLKDNCTVITTTSGQGDRQASSCQQFERDVAWTEVVAKGVMPAIEFWLDDFNQFFAVLSDRCRDKYNDLQLKPEIEHSSGRNKVAGTILVSGIDESICTIIWQDLLDGSRFVRIVAPDTFQPDARWKKDPGTFNFAPEERVSKIVDCDAFWFAFSFAVHMSYGRRLYEKKQCFFCSLIE
jgi:hypothetical protein